MDFIMEQPPYVIAVVLVVVVVVGMKLMSSSSTASQQESQKAADLASRELLMGEKKKKGGKQKPKQKKKKAAPVVAAPPAPVVVAAPAVAPVVKVEEPVVVAAAAPASKKKKKKQKKKAAAPESEPKVEEPKVVVAAVVDSDSDDDFDATLLLSQKQKLKVEPKKTKKQKKEEAKAAAAAGSDEAWVTVHKNGSSNGIISTTASENGKKLIPLSQNDPALIIGPKGATIQHLQETSGARLDVSKSALSGSSFLEISGSEAQILKATALVETLIATTADELQKKTAHSNTLEAKDIKGSDGVKAIIGKGGSTIKGIQTQTGTSLDANVDLGRVTITGPTAEGVKEATKLCKEAVFGASQHVMELKSRNMVRVVAGRDFTKLRALQTETGARLDIEKGTTTLELSGTVEAVQKARATIAAWIALNQGVTFQVEASKIGAVYGKAGQNIIRIQDKTNTFIDVEDKGKKGKELVDCTIMGEPDAVQEAKIMFLKSANGEVDLKPGEVLETIEVGPTGAPAIIGRGGSKIRELESTHSVKLTLSGDVCRVTGKKANVEAAKVAIDAIVQPLIEEQTLRAEADRLAQDANGDNNQWGAVPVDDDADGW